MIRVQREASYEAILSTDAWRSFSPRTGLTHWDLMHLGLLARCTIEHWQRVNGDRRRRVACIVYQPHQVEGEDWSILAIADEVTAAAVPMGHLQGYQLACLGMVAACVEDIRQHFIKRLDLPWLHIEPGPVGVTVRTFAGGSMQGGDGRHPRDACRNLARSLRGADPVDWQPTPFPTAFTMRETGEG